MPGFPTRFPFEMFRQLGEWSCYVLQIGAAKIERLQIESALAASTASSYVNVFKNHITPALGSLRLDEVTHEKMEEFVSNLVKKNLAKATIQTIIKDLCALFNHARKRKLIVENPASGLSQLYSQAKEKHAVIEPLTKKEVPLFLAAVRQRKESQKHYALFVTAIHAGLRPGELAGLQTGDIDFAGKYLIVQRSIDRIHRKIVPTKTKRIRRVDLSNELVSVLKAHLQEQKEYWLRHPRKKPDGTLDTSPPLWLFPNEEGEWRTCAISRIGISNPASPKPDCVNVGFTICVTRLLPCF